MRWIRKSRELLGRYSLSHPAIRGAAWTFGSYFTGQFLRFGSNLILTRLLMPEIFGLMVIVNIVIGGLEMFSDLGVGLSIIQNPKGEEDRFLRTAWTVQILRSLLLWAISLLLAWPVARLYNAPALTYILPLATLGVVIDAFTNPWIDVLNRRLQLSTIVLIELGAYALSIIAMILGALVSKTVWPLLVGGFVHSFLSMLISHFLGGPKMRFTLDREIAADLFHFGKWLFISSILTFCASHLDRLVLGTFLSLHELGVYSIAFMLSQVMVQVVAQLSRKVLFPLYSRTAELGPAQLRRQTIKVRSALLLITLPPIAALIVIAPELINFLYDDRYLAAGHYLQLLGAGALFATLLGPIDCVLMASGNTKRHMLLQFFRSATMLSAMLLGGWYAGALGVIYGYVGSQLAYYPFLAGLVRRYGVWLPWLDALALAGSGSLIASGLLIKSLVL